MTGRQSIVAEGRPYEDAITAEEFESKYLRGDR